MHGFSSDDYVKAKINEKYNINIAEVGAVKADIDSNGNYIYYKSFYGLFEKIELYNKIDFNLKIFSYKNKENSKLYNDKIEMDFSEFENNFDVFASDRIIAMQLLTLDIMEELLEFKNKTKEDFDIFINNNIYLRFNCGSIFEMDMEKDLLNEDIKTVIKLKMEEQKGGILNKKSIELYYNILKLTYELSVKLIKIIDEADI